MSTAPRTPRVWDAQYAVLKADSDALKTKHDVLFEQAVEVFQAWGKVQEKIADLGERPFESAPPQPQRPEASPAPSLASVQATITAALATDTRLQADITEARAAFALTVAVRVTTEQEMDAVLTAADRLQESTVQLTGDAIVRALQSLQPRQDVVIVHKTASVGRTGEPIAFEVPRA